MSDVFADTSFFVALVSSGDKHHSTAQRLACDRGRRLITTAWVLAELGAALRRPEQRRVYVELIATLRKDDTALLLTPDQEQFDSGLDLFAGRPDKQWSLTDCISFAVMRKRGLSEGLTADGHFQQAGFRALMPEG